MSVLLNYVILYIMELAMKTLPSSLQACSLYCVIATVESHVLCIQIQPVPHRERTLFFIESYQLMLSRGIIPSLLSKLYNTKRSQYNFYLCTVHFEIYAVHSPTNALFINLVKTIKFTLKCTIISLLHVSVSLCTAHNTRAALRHAVTSPNL